MRYKVLCLLDCAHLLTIRDTTVTPEHVFCPVCHDLAQVIDSVDSRPQVREDNGRTF